MEVGGRLFPRRIERLMRFSFIFIFIFTFLCITVTLPQNTINFGEREKKEMRELTKASEILSLFPDSRHNEDDHDDSKSQIQIAPFHPAAIPPIQPHKTWSPKDGEIWTTATHWDPSVGQVFLGNLKDVPA